MLALGIKGLELEVLKMNLEGAEVEKVFVRTSLSPSVLVRYPCPFRATLML